MDELVAKYGWKKVSIALIVLSIGMLILLFISTLNVDNKAFELQKKRTAISNDDILKEENNTQQAENLVYDDEYLKFEYPSTFTIREMTKDDFSIKALMLEDKSKGEIEIRILSKDKNNISDITKSYKDDKFLESSQDHALGKIKVFTKEEEGRDGMIVAILTKGNNIIKLTSIYNMQDSNSKSAVEKILQSIR